LSCETLCNEKLEFNDFSSVSNPIADHSSKLSEPLLKLYSGAPADVKRKRTVSSPSGELNCGSLFWQAKKKNGQRSNVNFIFMAFLIYFQRKGSKYLLSVQKIS
jgi:hypothetical protein